MGYFVKHREVKWRGQTHHRGSRLEVAGDREAKQVGLLVTIGKVEERPDGKPVRQAATVRARPRRTYSTRQLTAED